MGEEDLRTHFLVQLNGVYEGQATGETFNFEGKTDILIRADGGNIFIAERKFWSGELTGYEGRRRCVQQERRVQRRAGEDRLLAPSLVNTHEEASILLKHFGSSLPVPLILRVPDEIGLLL